MKAYFDEANNMQSGLHGEIKPAILTIANKFVADNPPIPLTYRLSSMQGLKRNEQCRYVFDFDRIFPDALNEQVCCAWGKLFSPSDTEADFTSVAYGPVRIVLNGALAYQSDFLTEKQAPKAVPVTLTLKKGYNEFIFIFIKTALGFGGEFGSAFASYFPITFFAPTPEREGQEGLIYSKPMPWENALPQFGVNERESGLEWLPAACWDAAAQKLGQLERIYGKKDGRFAFGWTKLNVVGTGGVACRLHGEVLGPTKVTVGGKAVFSAPGKGAVDAAVALPAGTHDVLVESVCAGDGWGFSLHFLKGGKELAFTNPAAVQGTKSPWLYIGPFDEGTRPALSSLTELYHTYRTASGEDYWRVNLPGMRVRPFLETTYGAWNYPTGVTLYGLLRIVERFQYQALLDYVKGHIEICTAYYRYCLWDKDQYGFPGLDNQFSFVDSLDDCGSFTCTILETAKMAEVMDYRHVADTVADYICNRQARLEDGAFYRPVTPTTQMNNTLWIDDLYMSVSFLTRYYTLTGDEKIVDDAAKQFLLYRKYLEVPEKNVMSHVYYTDRKLASRIPWGRGNGWMLFSLAELLTVLPQAHPLRPELIEMFRHFCKAFRALQGEEGLWHQVLTDPDSYPETSCTAIFIYAYARGVLSGWLTETDGYIAVAQKAWQGLMNHMVDKWGNVYGTCRGSNHSFTYRYYKYELLDVINDTHGIGPVLLAGAELQKLSDWMANA